MAAWTLDEVVSTLGDDAQVVPGGVIVHHFSASKGTSSNVLVASLAAGAFAVTPEGEEILEALLAKRLAPTSEQVAVAKIRKPRVPRLPADTELTPPPAPAVTPEPAPQAQLDLDLGDPELDDLELDVPDDVQLEPES